MQKRLKMKKIFIYFFLFSCVVPRVFAKDSMNTTKPKKESVSTDEKAKDQKKAPEKVNTMDKLTRQIRRAIKCVERNFGSLFNDPHYDAYIDNDTKNEDTNATIELKHGKSSSKTDKIFAEALEKVVYTSKDGKSFAPHIAAVVYIAAGLRVDPDNIIDSVRLATFSNDRFNLESDVTRQLIAKACAEIIDGEDIDALLSCAATSPLMDHHNDFYKKAKPYLKNLCYILLGRNNDNTADIPDFYNEDLTKSISTIHDFLKTLHKLNLTLSIYCPIYAALSKFEELLAKKPTLSRSKIADAMKKDESIEDAIKCIKDSIEFYKIYDKKYVEFFMMAAWDSLNENVIRKIYNSRSRKWSDDNEAVKEKASAILYFFFDEKSVEQEANYKFVDLIAEVDVAICSSEGAQK
jgi:hypothetical protein